LKELAELTTLSKTLIVIIIWTSLHDKSKVGIKAINIPTMKSGSTPYNSATIYDSISWTAYLAAISLLTDNIQTYGCDHNNK
jgi:hypothetical protein